MSVKKVNKTTLDKIISTKKLFYENTNPIRENNRSKTFLPPEENYLNFRESVKIPDFLNTKSLN